MHWVLTAIFMGIVLWFLAEGFYRPERMYQYPFLAGVMAFSFLFPQIPGVASDPFLPRGAYEKTMLMGILSLLALRLAWSERAPPLAMFRVALSEQRLVGVAGMFSAVGAFFYMRLSHLPGDLSIGVQMSGTPVIYLFFAKLMTYGLAIAMLCFVRRPSPVLAIIILVDLAFYFDRIVLTGKRAEAIELVLLILLPLWFLRGWVVPRLFIAAGLIVGTVGMVSMGDYRDITRAAATPFLQRVSEIDVMGNFEKTLEDGGQEFRNAVLRIDVTDRNLEFDYGGFHWNRLVFNYVPAQIVGAEFKDSLTLELPDIGRDYNPATGTTETGLADAFQSFWYFGALKFALVSFLMARLWASASEGQAVAQIVFALSIVPAMHAVSHQTDWVLSVWVHMLIFLLPALVFCVVPRGALEDARSPARASRPVPRPTPAPEGG